MSSKSMVRYSAGERVYVFAAYAIMTVFALSIVLPLIYIIQITFSGVVDSSFRLLPKAFTLNNYKVVFSQGLITRPFLNSVYVTALRTVISIVLTVMFAYPLSRKDLSGRKFLNFIVVLPMVIDLGFMPNFFQIRDLGLINSYWSLVLPVAVTPFNIIIMRNFFEGIPDSLFESARMDGCRELKIITKIVIPLSTAAIATVALFYMVASWNTYFSVILYINDASKFTLQVALRSMIIQNAGSISGAKMDADVFSTNLQYTTIVVAIIPVMLVYPFLQKYFVKGITIGAVKG